MDKNTADIMTPELTNQVTAGLLMLMLSSVLGMAVLLSIFVTSYLKRVRKNSGAGSMDKISDGLEERKYHLLGYGSLHRWLAIRVSNVSAVQTALGLHNPIPCSWGEGISKLSEHNLFISPPIQGWILVVGQGLPDPADDIDECFRLICRLSRSLGHVQFFSANRAVNHHAWAQAEDGIVRRGYAWAGETLWNQGAVTQAERDLGLKCFDYSETVESLYTPSNDSHQFNSEKLTFLASRWSLDPTAVDESMISSGHGIAGDLILSRQS